ncbi:hypothetical protein N8328_05495 [Crocinitomicaceae bacterium]|nr:hypothetical protein [Crocinitomicaceae bacterium]
MSKYLIAILLSLIGKQSFSKDDNIKMYSHSDNFYSYAPFYKVRLENPYDTADVGDINKIKLEVVLLIELCLKELIINNINLNQTDNNDLIKLEVLISNFGVKYNSELDNVIAIALGSNIDSKVIIDINKHIWNTLSNVEKLSTIFHEVCHDVLNVKHIDGDILNLMHPDAQPRNFDELQIMVDKFVRDYKLGRVQKFDEGFYIHDKTNNKTYILKSLK